MREVEIVSLGCRLNAFEGEAMSRLAAAAGLRDVVVVNSCAVTGEAVRQTRQAIRRARRGKPGAKVVVTGCAAQIDPGSFAAMSEVDAVLGNAEKLDVNEWRALADGAALRVNDIFATRAAAPQLIEAYGDRSRAFLQIQTGCDHRCTFCIIPYGRGPSRSTPAAAVAAAAGRLVAEGHAEIVLTGVDITSWGADFDPPSSLGRLVGRVLDETPGLKRLRLSSIDGAEIDAELFERVVFDERFAPHLHLSLQSGDDIILKRMKRRHARAQSVSLCAAIRAARPEIAFGADLIAGFPTETGAMFERSLALIEDAGLNYVHVFPFSPREGTPAALMPQLPGPTIKARSRRLREAGAAALERFLDSLVGAAFDAVIEAGGRARLANFAPAKLAAPIGAVGAIAKIRVIARDGAMLIAQAA